MDFSTDFDRDESVGNGGITRIVPVPNGPEDPTGWERTPPPTVSDDDHVLFDTEQVNASGLYAQFFQNSVLTNTGGRKVFGVDTNMIQGGGLTDGCEKDMCDVRLMSDDLPPDTEFSLQFILGSMPWLVRRVRLGEWISLETCELQDSGRLETGQTRPLTIVGYECFSITARLIGGAPVSGRDERLNAALLTLKRELHGIDGDSIKGVQDRIDVLRNNRTFRVRAEVRGTYRRPAYESKEYWVWREQKALSDIHRSGTNGHAKVHGLFDIDVMHHGVARLFACTRADGNGKLKEYGVDYNLPGNGGSLPRGWTKQVCLIEIETKIDGPLEARILLSGHEWKNVLVQEGGGNTRFLTLPETLTLIEGEHFVLEVKSASSPNPGAKVRATLLGPLFTPTAAP